MRSGQLSLRRSAHGRSGALRQAISQGSGKGDGPRWRHAVAGAADGPLACNSFPHTTRSFAVAAALLGYTGAVRNPLTAALRWRSSSSTHSDVSRLSWVGESGAVAEADGVNVRANMYDQSVFDEAEDGASGAHSARSDGPHTDASASAARGENRRSLAEGGAGEDVEEKLVEFTEEEAGHLDRLFRKHVAKRNCISADERARLEALIYEAFYRELEQTPGDPAMKYQAGLELQWIEEWAEDLLEQREPNSKQTAADTTDHAASSPQSPLSVTGPLVPQPVVRSQDDARLLIKKSVLERVELHKPLTYIIGNQPFFGCDILCGPPLLCPRPETELWTHWFVQEHLRRATQPFSVLDMCCGTGCIGVAIAKNVPLARVVAVDLLSEAVTVSNENARRNHLPAERYHARLGDMFDLFSTARASDDAHTGPVGAAAAMSPRRRQANAYPSTMTDASPSAKDGAQARGEEEEEASADVPEALIRRFVQPPTRPPTVIAAKHCGSLDVLVSNPPYVLPDQYLSLPRTITLWESKMALVGDDYRERRQYLYYKELCELGAKMLKPRRLRDPVLRYQPNFVVEVGSQCRLVASIMERSGLFEDVEVHLDFAQQERWISANSSH